jgi:hypothetical protein
MMTCKNCSFSSIPAGFSPMQADKVATTGVFKTNAIF